jgi:hypothetical protein
MNYQKRFRVKFCGENYVTAADSSDRRKAIIAVRRTSLESLVWTGLNMPHYCGSALDGT